MKRVGFLLSRLHYDLIPRIIGHGPHIRHLKLAIQWDPVRYQGSEILEAASLRALLSLEADSHLDVDTITSLFVNVRTVEIFVELHKSWPPYHRPCVRAGKAIVREIARIMRSGFRQPRSGQVQSMHSIVYPEGEYWKVHFLEEVSHVSTTGAVKFAFDVPDTSGRMT
jgi:hypothetical protein